MNMYLRQLYLSQLYRNHLQNQVFLRGGSAGSKPEESNTIGNLLKAVDSTIAEKATLRFGEPKQVEYLPQSNLRILEIIIPIIEDIDIINKFQQNILDITTAFQQALTHFDEKMITNLPKALSQFSNLKFGYDAFAKFINRFKILCDIKIVLSLLRIVDDKRYKQDQDQPSNLVFRKLFILYKRKIADNPVFDIINRHFRKAKLLTFSKDDFIGFKMSNRLMSNFITFLKNISKAVKQKLIDDYVALLFPSPIEVDPAREAAVAARFHRVHTGAFVDGILTILGCHPDGLEDLVDYQQLPTIGTVSHCDDLMFKLVQYANAMDARRVETDYIGIPLQKKKKYLEQDLANKLNLYKNDQGPVSKYKKDDFVVLKYAEELNVMPTGKIIEDPSPPRDTEIYIKKNTQHLPLDHPQQTYELSKVQPPPPYYKLNYSINNTEIALEPHEDGSMTVNLPRLPWSYKIELIKTSNFVDHPIRMHIIAHDMEFKEKSLTNRKKSEKFTSTANTAARIKQDILTRGDPRTEKAMFESTFLEAIKQTEEKFKDNIVFPPGGYKASGGQTGIYFLGQPQKAPNHLHWYGTGNNFHLKAMGLHWSWLGGNEKTRDAYSMTFYISDGSGGVVPASRLAESLGQATLDLLGAYIKRKEFKEIRQKDKEYFKYEDMEKNPLKYIMNNDINAYLRLKFKVQKEADLKDPEKQKFIRKLKALSKNLTITESEQLWPVYYFFLMKFLKLLRNDKKCTEKCKGTIDTYIKLNEIILEKDYMPSQEDLIEEKKVIISDTNSCKQLHPCDQEHVAYESKNNKQFLNYLKINYPKVYKSWTSSAGGKVTDQHIKRYCMSLGCNRCEPVNDRAALGEGSTPDGRTWGEIKDMLEKEGKELRDGDSYCFGSGDLGSRIGPIEDKFIIQREIEILEKKYKDVAPIMHMVSEMDGVELAEPEQELAEPEPEHPIVTEKPRCKFCESREGGGKLLGPLLFKSHYGASVEAYVYKCANCDSTFSRREIER